MSNVDDDGTGQDLDHFSRKNEFFAMLALLVEQHAADRWSRRQALLNFTQYHPNSDLYSLPQKGSILGIPIWRVTACPFFQSSQCTAGCHDAKIDKRNS